MRDSRKAHSFARVHTYYVYIDDATLRVFVHLCVGRGKFLENGRELSPPWGGGFPELRAFSQCLFVIYGLFMVLCYVSVLFAMWLDGSVAAGTEAAPSATDREWRIGQCRAENLEKAI